jgi:hypothetical protein
MTDQPKDYSKEDIDGLVSGLDGWITELKKETEDRMRGDVGCDKCGKDLGYGWDAKRFQSTLYGDYKAVLCPSCINLWHEHIVTIHKADWDVTLVLDAEENAIRTCLFSAGEDKIASTTDLLTDINTRRRALKFKFYGYAKAWAADKIPTPVAPTP